ncbi:MAG: hypothetical protein K2J06_07245, partial [Muribaculaceae bacterium]|nr:hypothetical protein [Muribaculaceae bacterium]
PGYSRISPAVDVPPTLSVMGLTAGESIYPRPASRGYAAAGYFPKGDIDLSAGYRIIDREKLTLNLWGQMCRNYFHGRLLGETEKVRLTTTDIAAGLSTAYSAGKAGVLRASTSYSYSMFNYPGRVMLPASQRVGIYRLQAAWDGKAGSNLTYGAEGRLGYTGYAKDAVAAPYFDTQRQVRSQDEISGRIGAWIDFKCSDRINLMLDIAYEGASRNKAFDSKQINMTADELILRKGVISVTPKVGFTGQHMSGHLGFNYSAATGNAKGSNFGADIAWDWLLSHYFAINIKAASGPVVNEFDRLFALSRYAMPAYGIGLSYVPIDAEASLRLLAIKGFTMSLGAGYAAANDWMSTGLIHNIYIDQIHIDNLPTFSSADLYALRFFASIGYRYGDKVEVEVSAEHTNCDYEEGIDFSGQKFYNWTDRAYYRNPDRATTIIRASALWHPIKSVTLSAGYEYRTGRSIASLDVEQIARLLPLGDISRLSVGAHWQITQMLGVYGRVEGLLQESYLPANGMPGQRLCPLVGLTLKF